MKEALLAISGLALLLFLVFRISFAVGEYRLDRSSPKLDRNTAPVDRVRIIEDVLPPRPALLRPDQLPKAPTFLPFDERPNPQDPGSVHEGPEAGTETE